MWIACTILWLGHDCYRCTRGWGWPPALGWLHGLVKIAVDALVGRAAWPAFYRAWLQLLGYTGEAGLEQELLRRLASAAQGHLGWGPSVGLRPLAPHGGAPQL